MHLILTGATGLVGSAVLDAMIKTKDISKISILSRRPVKMAEDAKDPRVNVILHKDFEKYDSELLRRLEGADGVVWALGISQTAVSKEEYTKITKDYALAAARAFRQIPRDEPKPFAFVHVSGAGATLEPGRFSAIFARVKGETELALAEMRREDPLFQSSTVRPCFIDWAAHDAIKPHVPPRPFMLGTGEVVLGPVIRAAFKSYWSPTVPLGRFLTGMAMRRFDGDMDGAGIEKVRAFPVIENVAFRRLMGL